MGFLGDLGLSAANGVLSVVGNEIASNTARKNLDYQMDKYYSPQAQVKNLGAAGLNPAVAFGNQSPTFSGGGQLQMPSNPLAGIGTTSLTDLANYMNAKANVKKAGADTRKSDAEADAISFENELNRIFKQPERVANLLAAYKSIQLQEDEHSINEWRKAKEKALSELSGIERDSAKKTFDNMDTVIEQQNRQREEDIKLTKEKQKTEGTQQSANRASAAAALSQAELNQHQQELIDYQREFQEMVNKVKRSNLSSEMLTNLKKLLAERHLSETQQKEAELRLSHVQAFINARNMSAAWREFDNACNWISSKISASISGTFSSVSKD